MFETVLFLYYLLAKPGQPSLVGASDVVLASRSFSMEKRYDVPSVNQVFKDNILLTLRYLGGDVKSKAEIDWIEIEKPFNIGFTLNPGEAFAFQDQIVPEYKEKVVKTTNAHFNWADGFKSDGYLTGDGVCHLASFINWVAKDAGLNVVYFANHNFAKINEVPREYGVSIKFDPVNFGNSSRQNLYITNNKEGPVDFKFDFDGTNLTVSVITEA